MSFFVSNSLKDIISEKDLEAESPIKIIEEEQDLKVVFIQDEDITFDVDLIEINFDKAFDEMTVKTDYNNLINIFSCENKQIQYYISFDERNYMDACGQFELNKLEVNKEDKYVVCKIDIFKRGY